MTQEDPAATSPSTPQRTYLKIPANYAELPEAERKAVSLSLAQELLHKQPGSTSEPDNPTDDTI